MGVLCLLAFYRHKTTKVEENSRIYNKKMHQLKSKPLVNNYVAEGHKK